MPIYEFECNECHKSFEKLCSMKDDLSQVECEFCKVKNVRKKMSSFATGNQRNTLNVGGSGDCGGHSHSHGGGSCSCGDCSSHSCSSCH